MLFGLSNLQNHVPNTPAFFIYKGISRSSWKDVLKNKSDSKKQNPLNKGGKGRKQFFPGKNPNTVPYMVLHDVVPANVAK